MTGLWQDIRFGARALGKTRGFTIVVVSTLAVAIGATTAICSVVHSTILDPLPIREPDRLMNVFSFGSYVPYADKLTLAVNPVTVAALRHHSELFEELTIRSEVSMKYRVDNTSKEVSGYRVSPNYLSIWGARPMLGRTFGRGEDDSDDEPAIILSHAFWRGRFAGDQGILDKTVDFGDGTEDSPLRHFRVVGVMPPHFRPPGGSASYWIAASDPMVRPSADHPDIRPYRDRDYWVTLRLADGVKPQRVQELLNVIHARQVQDDSQANQGWVLRLKKVTDDLVDPKVRRSLWTLFTGVALVWVIACANITSLLMARAEGRCHELAMRSALGAQRSRLLRLLLVESLLLSLIGGLCGLAVTSWGLQVLDTFLTGTRFRSFELSWNVFGISLLMALVTAMTFGLVPAWFASRPRLNKMLKQTGAAITQGLSGRWLMRGLVISEVTLSFILLASAGLMVQSVVRLLKVDMWYPIKGLVRADVMPPFPKYLPGTQRAELTTRLHEAFLTLPGVKDVGVMTRISGWHEYYVEDPQNSADVVEEGCGLDNRNPFIAIGLPLKRGRFLDGTDRNQNTVVVNETLAQTFFPNSDALGKTFRNVCRGGESEKIWEIVGVVGDMKDRSFDQKVKPTFYRCSLDHYEHSIGVLPIFFVRSSGDGLPLIRSLGNTIRTIEPDIQDISVARVGQQLYEKTKSRRRYTLYLSLLTGVGVALAAMGIYGLLAHAVVRRTREMGIRMALGATHDAVGWMLIRTGTRLVLVGIILGCAGTLAVTRLMRNQLFNVKPHDPMTLLIAAVVLFLLAIAASAIPARRAAKVDPMEALRYE